MELNPEDLAKITDFTLRHYNEHAEDFWEGTRDHNVKPATPNGHCLARTCMRARARNH